MPTRYKPDLDNKPLGWESAIHGHADVEIERLVAALRSNAVAMTGVFKRCDVELDFDDVEPFILQLQCILVKFVAECRAHPLRTPRQLLPTVKLIKENPARFLEGMANYSPQAVALVYERYLQLFPNKCDLEAFEWGRGPAPEEADIASAAEAAIRLLEVEATRRLRGRPPMECVEDLSVNLGKLFIASGGHLRRTFHDQEGGPFHEFLTVIAELVRPVLWDTGYTLTPETMVRFARAALVR